MTRVRSRPLPERVLVLDADGRTGLACVQSLGRQGAQVHAGVRALGSSTERSRWCARVHLQPPAEPPAEGAAWLRALDRQHAFDLVLPATEAALRWLRLLPEAHALRRRAVLPGDAALDTALSKEATRALAERLGLPVPASRLLARGAPPPPPTAFPCVLKPVTSKVAMHGRLATLAAEVVRDPAARQRVLDAWLPHTDVQEQAWVPGRGVGAELVFDHGREVAAFVHERLHEWPLTGGASTWRRSAAPDPRVLEPSRRLLGALGWHGAAMVEWRRASDGALSLMEVNPRLWGSLPLTLAAGVDVPRLLLALARGEAPAPVTRYRVGVTARNLTNDLQWLRADARANHADPLLLTQPLAPAALGWLRGLTGREVYDGWSAADPAVARSEVLALLRAPLAALARRARHRLALGRARRAHGARFGPGAAAPRPVRRVLFLCLGNICRSPFAAEAARSRLRGVTIDSAGFHPRAGRVTPAHVVEAARGLGVDLAAWRSTTLRAEQVAQADLIVAMDLSQLERLAAAHPEALPRATLLGLFDPAGAAEIEDPYTLPSAAARAVLERITRALDALAAQLPPLQAPR